MKCCQASIMHKKKRPSVFPCGKTDGRDEYADESNHTPEGHFGPIPSLGPPRASMTIVLSSCANAASRGLVVPSG